MTNALIERLRNLSPSAWRANPPATEEAIAKLEKGHELQLPADHRELLLYSDGGSLSDEILFHLQSVKQMSAQNADEELQESVPELFAIGDDGGGALYMYDRTGALGHGAYAVYLVPLSSLDAASSWFCGATFGEVINAVLDGKNFRKGPRLGPR